MDSSSIHITTATLKKKNPLAFFRLQAAQMSKCYTEEKAAGKHSNFQSVMAHCDITGENEANISLSIPAPRFPLLSAEVDKYLTQVI